MLRLSFLSPSTYLSALFVFIFVLLKKNKIKRKISLYIFYKSAFINQKTKKHNHQSKNRFHSPAQFRGLEWERNQTKFGKTKNELLIRCRTQFSINLEP